MKVIMSKFREQSLFKQIVVILLIVLFIYQFGMDIYFNLATLPEHMGFDSSWVYLKSALIWIEKSINSNIWVEQTGTYIDSSVPIAALIYGITGNVFFSFGLGNCIILLLILICMYSITKKLNFKIIPRLVCLNLVVCPYLTNGFSADELTYFANVISGPAFYNLRTLLCVVVIRNILEIKETNKIISKWFFFSIILSFVTGISVGIFTIIVILIPCIAYILEMTFIKNDIKRIISKEAIFIYIASFSVIIGKFVSKYIFTITTIDSTRTFTSISNIWNNALAVFQGFMKLVGALPVTDSSIEIVSNEGIAKIFSLFLFVIILIGVIYAIYKVIKNLSKVDSSILLITNFVVCNFIVLSLFNVQYGMALFEERYLICCFMAIILLVGYFINNLKENQVFSVFIMVGILLVILVNNLISNNIYLKSANDMDEYKGILAEVNNTDAKLVYVWNNDPNNLWEMRTLSRNLRVYDLSRVYKCVEGDSYYHWGDYLYYENSEDYIGKTILIIDKDDKTVSEELLKNYTFIKDIEDNKIYISNENNNQFN